MRFLRIINSPKWDIVAVVEEEHGQQSCGLLDFFEQLEKSGGFNGSIDGMFALLEHVATSERGPNELSDKLCHLVDGKHQIFEFIKGRIRILWFYGEANKLIVCSHGFIKKTQKTPKEEVGKCVTIMERYQQAHQDNAVDILDELEEVDHG